jgi:hypothetical protein
MIAGLRAEILARNLLNVIINVDLKMVGNTRREG